MVPIRFFLLLLRQVAEAVVVRVHRELGLLTLVKMVPLEVAVLLVELLALAEPGIHPQHLHRREVMEGVITAALLITVAVGVVLLRLVRLAGT